MIQILRKTLFFSLALLLSSFLEIEAQTGTIRGFVYYKENGESVIFTNVYLLGTTHGASTDVNGFYSITKIPPGNYTLIASYLGYDTLKTSMDVNASDIITKNIYLEKSSISLRSVEVSGERQEKKTDIRISVQKITPIAIKKMPAIGGEPDLAQYLQVLPGVVFTGDQGGQLYIRGGSPIQNKVILDGMVIYNPFHSIGLFSVFDTDIIRNVDIYTGGFSSDYGGRISSIIDIKTKDGNKNRLGGNLSASPFQSKLLIEGPIKKLRESEAGNSSFIISSKTSYLKESSPVLYSYIDSTGLPYNFTDLYAKLSLNSGNGSKVNFFGFRFNDNVNYQQVSNLNWNSYGFGSSFVLVPTGSTMLLDGNFAYSNYNIELAESDEKPRSSLIRGFNFGLNFTYFIKKDAINYGIEVLGFKTLFEFYNSVNRRLEQNENTTELAGFFKYKKILDRLILEPGIRLHYYASLDNFSPEPRLGLKYLLSETVRLKFAGGRYSQNLISATSDRDVVNLFYGFLSGPENIQKTFKGKEITHKLQTAVHGIAGIEYDLLDNIDINIEGYFKRFTQLTNINRNKIYDDNSQFANKPDYQKKDFIIETGDAYGLDILCKYEATRIYVWAAYSLSFVNRYDGIIEYQPHFDRRHNINFLTTYRFGKDKSWEANLRWNFGSGFPFTKTQGFYEKIILDEGINTDYTTYNGELGILYGSLNQGRLPYYHRLDGGVKKYFKLTNRSKLEVTFSITNVYNRANIFYFDRIRHKRVNQLPILPAISVGLEF